MIASFLFESHSNAGNGALLASIPASKAMYLENFFISTIHICISTQSAAAYNPAIPVTYLSVEDEPLEW